MQLGLGYSLSILQQWLLQHHYWCRYLGWGISLFLERAITFMENDGSKLSDCWPSRELILAKHRKVVQKAIDILIA